MTLWDLHVEVGKARRAQNRQAGRHVVVTALAVPMGLRALAIDLALGRTGIAGHRADWSGPVVWTFDTTRLKLIGHARQVVILREIVRAAKLVRPQVVFLEELYSPVAGALGEGFFSLAYMHGVVRYYLESIAPLVVVNNQHIRIYATGSAARHPQGKTAAKKAMMAEVNRRYGFLLDRPVTDDNQSDALTLLALGSHGYGCPLPTAYGAPVPDTHLRALTMVGTWPVIAGHESPAGPTATTSRGSGRAKAVKA